MVKEWKVWKKTKRILYEVSNKGRCRKNGIIFEPTKYDNEYITVFGNRLHRIVALLFIPNPYNKPCVDHIDNNKHNNNIDNLRWVTYHENMINPITLQRNKETQKIVQKQYYEDHPERAKKHSEWMKQYWANKRLGSSN